MAKINSENTANTLKELVNRDGGGLYFENKESINSFSSWATAVSIPKDYKPFKISILDTNTRADTVTLIMLINPKDLSTGQPFVSSSTNTRSGWVNTLWGNQQLTMAASGLTAGFYYSTESGSGGLTNFYRKNSLAYLNLLSIISLFKNNAYYFMDGQENPTMFRSDGKSRVINVMDVIHISYDGSDYLGNFSSFSVSDSVTNPYRMEYNFEFVASLFGSDPSIIDGHVKKNGNDKSNKVIIAIQGKNTDFNEAVQMNQMELNEYFPQQEYSEKYVDQNYVIPMSGDVVKDTTAQLKIDEGVRTDVYKDTKGNLTVGIGHLVLPSDKLAFGDTISPEQVEGIFNRDYAIHAAAAARVVPGLASMPENIQCAVINMTFNLGETKLSGFTGFIELLEKKDYEGAADSLKRTAWHDQVGPRALRIEKSIRETGTTTVANASGK